MRHRLTMGQKPTTCGLDRCANEMSCRHGGRYLFAHNRDGSTTSTQSRNLTACRIDRIPQLLLARRGDRITVWFCRTAYVGFSNRPSGVKHFQAIHQLQRRCRSRARASLRTRHQGPSIMGFEDEVEQSYGRPCRHCNGRFKPTYELTSSIVPRGTSFHRWVDLRSSPI